MDHDSGVRATTCVEYVNRSLRWDGTIFPQIQAYERKRASHIARYGAAPETIPLFDDHGMSKILGVTQTYVYGLELAAEGSVKMEKIREGLNNPRTPEPLPVRTKEEQRARDKRMGVEIRARRPASWNRPAEERR